MLNEEMSAGTNAEQSTNDETQLPSSHNFGNTDVVRSPNFVSTKKMTVREVTWLLVDIQSNGLVGMEKELDYFRGDALLSLFQIDGDLGKQQAAKILT